MKLYTKKMTYSLLAIGLLACAPVDAGVNEAASKVAAGTVLGGGTLAVGVYGAAAVATAAGAAAAAGGAAAGVARGAEAANCKRMCRGYFVDDANNKKLTGVIKKGDIKFKLKGALKKRTCHCEYKGDLGINKKQEFNQRDARKSKTQKHLKKVSKHADRKKCNKSKEMCLS